MTNLQIAVNKDKSLLVTWGPIKTNDCEAFEPGYFLSASVQFSGEMDGVRTCLEGSNDGKIFEPITEVKRNGSIQPIHTPALFIRPMVEGEAAKYTNIMCRVLIHRK